MELICGGDGDAKGVRMTRWPEPMRKELRRARIGSPGVLRTAILDRTAAKVRKVRRTDRM